MKLVEIPGSIDLMTILTIGQVYYKKFEAFKMADVAAEAFSINEKMMSIGCSFCGTALHIQNILGDKYVLTPTVAYIGEEGFRDGVCSYCILDPDMNVLPEYDSRIDNAFCFFGSYDLDQPFVEIWYGDVLVCKAETTFINGHWCIHSTMCDESLVDHDIHDLVNNSILDAITRLNMVKMAGYKYGKDLAEQEMEGMM
jgi:hypothetical protein